MQYPVDFGAFFFQLENICQQKHCTLAEACAKLRQAHFGYVEIDFDQVNDTNLAVLRKADLQVSSIFCFLNFRQDVETRLEKLLAIARRIRPRFVMPIPEEDTELALRPLILQQLRCLQQALATERIQMVMEDYDGPGKTFASTVGLQRYLAEIPGLKCCFDTGNFFYLGEDILPAWRSLADQVVHLHFKDRRRDERDGWLSTEMADGSKVSNAAIGNGFLPLQEFFQTVLQHGYRGIVVIEHACCHDQLDTLKSSIATMEKWCKTFCGEK